MLNNANGIGKSTPTFTPNVTGDYVVKLIVTDEGGLPSEPAYVTLSSYNQAPTAVATRPQRSRMFGKRLT